MENDRNKKPGVLFILPDLGAGGAQPMNLRLAQQLASRGWAVRVAILFNRPQLVPELSLKDLEVRHLNAQSTFSKLMLPLRLALHARKSDIVIGGMELAATNYGFCAARLARRAFVSWTHIAYNEHQYTTGKIDRCISKLIFRHTDRIVFPSAGARDSLKLALGNQRARTDWRVIANFSESSCPKINTAPSEAFRKPCIISVGRLVSQKAFARLIRVHAKLRREGHAHHLVIVGDGPLRDELEEAAENLGVHETVFLPGHSDNVADWLRHATVFALCSNYEGFSLALLEALDAGLPTVAMDCPSGPREILQNGYVGVLTELGDESAFQKALSCLLTSKNLRNTLSQRAKKRAADYRPEYIVPLWENFLLSAIRTRDSKRE